MEGENHGKPLLKWMIWGVHIQGKYSIQYTELLGKGLIIVDTICMSVIRVHCSCD